MRTRKGFTLVEMLVATVLATIVLAAVYQTLTVQQRGARRLETIVSTQQTVRTGLQYLQGELREVGATAGDIEEAAPDHIRIRAMRKVGVVCGSPISATQIAIYTFGDGFALNDTVAVNADQLDTNPGNDVIVAGQITQLDNGTAGVCTETTGVPWANMNTQSKRITLSMFGGATLAGVSPGAPVRSYKKVTYGVYTKGTTYVFGRRDATSADTVATLIAPLAANGLTFSYFDTAGNAVTGSSLTAAQRGSLGRVRVAITGRTGGYADPGGPYTASLVSDVFLRGN